MSMTANELCPYVPKLLADCARELEGGFEPTAYLNLGTDFRDHFREWCESFQAELQNQRWPTHYGDYETANGSKIVAAYNQARNWAFKALTGTGTVQAYRLQHPEDKKYEIKELFAVNRPLQLAAVQLDVNEKSAPAAAKKKTVPVHDDDGDDVIITGAKNVLVGGVDRSFKPSSGAQLDWLALRIMSASSSSSDDDHRSTAARGQDDAFRMVDFGIVQPHFRDAVMFWDNNNCFAASVGMALQCMRPVLVPRLQTCCKTLIAVTDELRFLFDLFTAPPRLDAHRQPIAHFHEVVELPANHAAYSAPPGGGASEPAEFFDHMLKSILGTGAIDESVCMLTMVEREDRCSKCGQSHVAPQPRSYHVLPLSIPEQPSSSFSSSSSSSSSTAAAAAISVAELISVYQEPDQRTAICSVAVASAYAGPQTWDEFVNTDGTTRRLAELERLDQEFCQAQQVERESSKRRKSHSSSGLAAAPGRDKEAILGLVIVDYRDLLIGLATFANREPARKADIERRFGRILTPALDFLGFSSERVFLSTLDTDSLPHFLCLEIKRLQHAKEPRSISLDRSLRLGEKTYKLVYVCLNDRAKTHIQSLVRPPGLDEFHFFDNLGRHGAHFTKVAVDKVDEFKHSSSSREASRLATLLVYEEAVAGGALANSTGADVDVDAKKGDDEEADEELSESEHDDEMDEDECDEMDEDEDDDEDEDEDGDEEEEEEEDDNDEDNDDGDDDDESTVTDSYESEWNHWTLPSPHNSSSFERLTPVCDICYNAFNKQQQVDECDGCNLRRKHHECIDVDADHAGGAWECRACRLTALLPETTPQELASLRSIHRLRTALIAPALRRSDEQRVAKDSAAGTLPHRVAPNSSADNNEMRDIETSALFQGVPPLAHNSAILPFRSSCPAPSSNELRNRAFILAPPPVEPFDVRVKHKSCLAVAMRDRGMTRHEHELRFPFRDCQHERNWAAFNCIVMLELTERESAIVKYCKDNLYLHADYWGLEVRVLSHFGSAGCSGKEGGERGVFFTQNMRKGTLIAMYSGEVDFFAYHTHDVPVELFDNFLTLIDSKDARTALIISQNHFGNIARFINSPRGSEKANTAAVRRADADGRVGVYFVLTEDVRAEQQALFPYGPLHRHH